MNDEMMTTINYVAVLFIQKVSTKSSFTSLNNSEAVASFIDHVALSSSRGFFFQKLTPFVLNCHTVKNCHLEVCLQCSRLLNDNSKLKSDDYTL